ncbi:twin-arginine translocase subunit TatB [Pseudolysobacter antarcticus]|uniref:Sec-independent protein translocase protein TatB n=1 Tax=Pseudolysobacter antarcticus TaxID=2511995 RepID=A0A411HEP5_9GAMM|nr:Sec-independent protein translocase protein TatB [Pseudolysobacter antarcticus]QBB68951.1 twin-arginine translocase subunit TatB [Pseudolysobacter antarcticus]
MFDFSMGEIGIIAVVSLLVLGPERMPKVARTTGALLRKARQSWQNVRNDIEREFAAEELKRNLKETVQSIDPRPAMNDAINGTMQDIHGSIHPNPAPAVSETAIPDHGANEVLPNSTTSPPRHDEHA